MHFISLIVGLVYAKGDLDQAGVKVTEGYFPNNIKVEVYTRTWEPTQKPVAHMVYVHGHAEHINRYNSIFSEFAKAGIKVHSFDQVGNGRTGKRANDLGGALGVERVRQDIDDAITRIYDKQTPLFLMGHSFGGLSVVDYLARGNKSSLLFGAIASAPALEASPETMPDENTIQQIIGVAAKDPKLKLPTDLDLSLFTRNKTEVELYKDDPFTFEKCAAVQIRDAFTGGRFVLDGGYRKIKVSRFLLSHGTADKITSYKASEKLILNLAKQSAPRVVKFQSYAGAYHELHTDLVKNTVINNYIRWITSEVKLPN